MVRSASTPRIYSNRISVARLFTRNSTRPLPAVRWRRVNRCTTTFLCLNAGLAVLHPPKSADKFYRRDSVQTIHLTISEVNLQMHDALPERIFVPGTWLGRCETGKRRHTLQGQQFLRPKQRHKRSFSSRSTSLKKATLPRAAPHRFGQRRAVRPVQRTHHHGHPPCRGHPGIAPQLRAFFSTTNSSACTGTSSASTNCSSRRTSKKRGCSTRCIRPPWRHAELRRRRCERITKAFEPKTNAADKKYDELIELFRDIELGLKTRDAAPLEQQLRMDEALKPPPSCCSPAASTNSPAGIRTTTISIDIRAPAVWSYIPWDLDVGFADRAFGRLPVLEGWNAAWPVPGGPPPILEAIVTIRVAQGYRAIADGILEKHFKPRNCTGSSTNYMPSSGTTSPRTLSPAGASPTRTIRATRISSTNSSSSPPRGINWRAANLISPANDLSRIPVTGQNHRDPAPGNAPNGPTGLKVVSASTTPSSSSGMTTRKTRPATS